MIALVALLPAVIRRCPSWRGTGAGAALGALWGVASYLAQENLIAGATGALVVGSLLLLSGTSPWPAVRAALAAALTGFLLSCLPVLAFYAIHGDLAQFLTLYFLNPDATAQGYGDTSWSGGLFPLTTMFYARPFLLAVIALLVVFEARPVRIATGWSRERTRLAVTVIITVLLYQGALLRSDSWHMTGTMLMVPALVIMTSSALPRLLGARRLTAALVGAAVGVASFTLLPRSAYAWTSLRSAAEAPYLDRQRLAADSPPGQPTTLAARRIGAGLDTAPSMAPLVPLMNRIHAVIGSRTTYVADYPHGIAGFPGFVYFVADLTPAPVLYDKYMTVLNEPQLIAYMRYFQASVLPHIQALVTSSLGTPEARFFLRHYPGARRITLYDGRQPYHLLLAGSASGAPLGPGPVHGHAADRRAPQAEPAEDVHPAVRPGPLNDEGADARLLHVDLEVRDPRRVDLAGEAGERLHGPRQGADVIQRRVDEAAPEPEVKVRVSLEQHPRVAAVGEHHHDLPRLQVPPVQAFGDERGQRVG
jgi:hypothetical protein